MMRRKQGRSGSAMIVALLLALPAAAQTSGSSIVEEALKGATQDQQRDSDRVRDMVEEAVKGAEQAPSGEDAVNPEAPASLRPLTGDEPGVLPAGFRAEALKDRPVRDGSGTEIGTLRGLALDEASGLAQVMVEFQPLFGKGGKISAVPVETLAPATEGDGYMLELTQVDYDAMPAYRWAGEAWRREGA